MIENLTISHPARSVYRSATGPRFLSTLEGQRFDVAFHSTHGVCQVNGVTGSCWCYFRPADRRPSKVISKALSAAFQRLDQRRCPLPVGSRLMIAR